MHWCKAFPVPSVEVNAIARLLAGEIIARHGAPRVLLSDSTEQLSLSACSGGVQNFHIQKVKVVYVSLLMQSWFSKQLSLLAS